MFRCQLKISSLSCQLAKSQLLTSRLSSARSISNFPTARHPNQRHRNGSQCILIHNSFQLPNSLSRTIGLGSKQNRFFSLSICLREGEAIVQQSEVVTNVSSNELKLDFLPEKPIPLPETQTEVLHWVGDPPLDTLGLASWWPPGRMQAAMEYIHGTIEVPWWATIVLTTLTLRLLTFPLVVKMQRNAANLNNNNPRMLEIQAKITEARKRGDLYDVQKHSMDLKKFMEEIKFNPISNFLPILAQFPIFLSMFIGLRGMANLPLESMMTGGMLWFPDLTIADPYYGLPILTSGTLFLQLKFASEGVSLDTVGPVGKIVLRCLPFCLLPLTINFPAAITFYWFATNVISITQASIIRHGKIRKYLKIPIMIKHDKKKIPGMNKGFRESFRDMLDNAKVQGDILERQKYGEDIFRGANTGKQKQTFKFDPSKEKQKQ